MGRSGAPVALVRAVLIATMVALGLAAVVHIVRYALLLINRTTLLSPWVAWLATWSGRGVSALVQLGMLVSVVLLTSWLIGRRARAFAERDATDPRSETKMWLCCLLPVVNLVMAPVFVIELADAEGRLSRMRTTIVIWWWVWVFSGVVSTYANATAWMGGDQHIADNTVATTVAYLAALAAMLLTYKVFMGFERTTVDRHVKRWVVVTDESPRVREEPEPTEAQDDTQDADVPVAVDEKQREPAA